MSDNPTESAPPAQLPSEEALLRALRLWLDQHPLPRTLQPLLRAATFDSHREAQAGVMGIPLDRLLAWERCFARWAPVTLEQAVAQIWSVALRARGANDER